jgi:hypothetical protein
MGSVRRGLLRSLVGLGLLGLVGVAGAACAAGGEVYPDPDAGGDSARPQTDAGVEAAAQDAAPDLAQTDVLATDGQQHDAGGTDGQQHDGGGDAACTGNGTTPDNCGPCGVVCPGYGETTAEVGCTTPNCTFACKGEAYDCNGDPDDGCEVADTFQGTHTQATALYLGSFGCGDSESAQNISGLLPGDARTHDPAISGFDAAKGDAPDWFRIHGAGGALCQDDINLTLQVTGSATPGCFRLRAITNVSTYTCQTSGSGSCNFSPGMSSYGDGTDIYLVVDKTCSSVAAERVSYTITGHL